MHGSIYIKRVPHTTPFAIRINARPWSIASGAPAVVNAAMKWMQYWTRSAAWTKLNYEGKKMIRVLIKKEPPFEIHVVVNPSDALNVEKIEAEGHYLVGEFDGEKQIDDAVASVATYLELEESHTE
jgi:hypothetical protein